MTKANPLPNKLRNFIANTDCIALLKQLPTQSVDLVVSSPPYNIGKSYESRVHLDSYLESMSVVLRECARVLKSTGSIFWQVGAYSNKGAIIPLDIKFFPILEELDLIPRNRIVWARQHGLHAKNKFSCRHESILWFTKSEEYYFDLDAIRVPQKYQNKKHHKGDKHGELSCNPSGKNPGDIWLFRNVKHNHEEQTIHPCQFPEDMISRIVLGTTPTNGVCLDPYMGTGTVAVVAQNLNRYFVGAELDPDYHRVALRRLEGTPDKYGVFPNLKTLRDYCERTGDSVENYSFEVQVGRKPTDRSKSKITPEQVHLDEMAARISYEEAAFSADLRGEKRPEDLRLNGKSRKQRELFTC